MEPLTAEQQEIIEAFHEYLPANLLDAVGFLDCEMGEVRNEINCAYAAGDVTGMLNGRLVYAGLVQAWVRVAGMLREATGANMNAGKQRGQ